MTRASKLLNEEVISGVNEEWKGYILPGLDTKTPAYKPSYPRSFITALMQVQEETSAVARVKPGVSEDDLLFTSEEDNRLKLFASSNKKDILKIYKRLEKAKNSFASEMLAISKDSLTLLKKAGIAK